MGNPGPTLVKLFTRYGIDESHTDIIANIHFANGLSEDDILMQAYAAVQASIANLQGDELEKAQTKLEKAFFPPAEVMNLEEEEKKEEAVKTQKSIINLNNSMRSDSMNS